MLLAGDCLHLNMYGYFRNCQNIRLSPVRNLIIFRKQTKTKTIRDQFPQTDISLHSNEPSSIDANMHLTSMYFIACTSVVVRPMAYSHCYAVALDTNISDLVSMCAINMHKYYNTIAYILQLLHAWAPLACH